MLARAVLGAGGRFYMPTASDPAYIERLEEALAGLADADGAVRARLLARLAEHLRSRTTATGPPASAPRRWRWPVAPATRARSSPR